MATALNIIEGAGKLIGVIRKSESMSADEAADGLTALNDMIESWSNSSLLIYTRTKENFTLTPSTATYSIGASQTFNTTKPIKIVEAFIRENSIDHPLRIISDDEYQEISMKSTGSNIPQFLMYNNAHPYGTITLYETPSAANALHLLSEKVLSSFASTSTSVDLPAGWNKALKYNLAVALAPEYGVKVDPLVLRGAIESKEEIKKAVSRNRSMSYKPEPAGAGRMADFYSGYF